MRRLVFDSDAFDDFCHWCIENKKAFTKKESDKEYRSNAFQWNWKT